MNELLVLDVGHGNSAILFSNSEVAIFDAAPSDTLLLTLERYDIKQIDHVYISHSDKDHIGGLINLLASKSLVVKNLYLNPDSTKKGRNIRLLRNAIDDAMERYGLNFNIIHTGQPKLSIGSSLVEVIYPNVSDLLSGPGGVDTDNSAINSNSSSAVLRLFHNNHPVALLAGDMEHATLDAINRRNPSSLLADILVFPHHGGNCSTNNKLFATTLLALTKAKYSVFSLGRDSFSNPRPEIIEAIRDSPHDTCIMCTQLSKNCLSNLPEVRDTWNEHLSDVPGLGRNKKISCAGSVRIVLDGYKSFYSKESQHQDFILDNIVSALCKL